MACLFDLGLSSFQLADASAGFSFRTDGPLDMRFDTGRGLPAAELLATLDAAELTALLRRYGEEPFAGRIARAIVEARRTAPIRDRRGARGPRRARRARRAPRAAAASIPATRVFQALRIAVNEELEALEAGLRRRGRPAPARRPARRPELPLARGPDRQALLPGGAARLHLPARGCRSASAAARRACASSPRRASSPTAGRDRRQPPRPERPAARSRAAGCLAAAIAAPVPVAEGGAPDEQAPHRPTAAGPTAAASTSCTSGSTVAPIAAAERTWRANRTSAGFDALGVPRHAGRRPALRLRGLMAVYQGARRRAPLPLGLEAIAGRRAGSVIVDRASERIAPRAAAVRRPRARADQGRRDARQRATPSVGRRHRARRDRPRVQRGVPLAEPERAGRGDGLRHRSARLGSRSPRGHPRRTSSPTSSGSGASRRSASRRSTPASASSARPSSSPPASERNPRGWVGPIRAAACSSLLIGFFVAASTLVVRLGYWQVVAARPARRERPAPDLLPDRGPEPPRPDLRPERHRRARRERDARPADRLGRG